MRLALALAFLLAAGHAAAPVSASEATELAAKIVAAYGGAEAIARSGSFRQSGALESNRHGATGTIERSYRRPDRLRIEIRIPGAPPESRILDGDRGWRDGRPVPPMMAKAMLLQAARLDLPWMIQQAGAGLQSLGPVDRGDGRDLRALEIPMAEGLRLIAVVDARTGYIASSHGRIEVAPGQGMEFATAYAGYRELGGMVVATEEDHFAQGMATGHTVLETSEPVPEFPDGAFRP